MDNEAPQSRESRIQSVLKDLEAPPASPPEGQPPAPPEEVKVAAPEGQPPAPPEEVKDEPPPPSDSIKASFDKLVKEKAALRAESERLKPYVDVLKSIDPNSLAALAKAKTANDPLSALAALGFSYADVTNRMLDVHAEGAAPREEKPEEKPAANPELAEIRKELAELKQVRAAQMREDILGKMKAAVPADKFPLIAGMGEHETVMRYIDDFYARTGSPPGETFEETVAIAAEAVEQHLNNQASRWKKVLTPAAQDANVQDTTGTRGPPAGEATTGKTLTNATTTAPRGGVPEPRSREEILKSLMDDPNVSFLA